MRKWNVFKGAIIELSIIKEVEKSPFSPIRNMCMSTHLELVTLNANVSFCLIVHKSNTV